MLELTVYARKEESPIARISWLHRRDFNYILLCSADYTSFSTQKCQGNKPAFYDNAANWCYYLVIVRDSPLISPDNSLEFNWGGCNNSSSFCQAEVWKVTTLIASTSGSADGVETIEPGLTWIFQIKLWLLKLI